MPAINVPFVLCLKTWFVKEFSRRCHSFLWVRMLLCQWFLKRGSQDRLRRTPDSYSRSLIDLQYIFIMIFLLCVKSCFSGFALLALMLMLMHSSVSASVVYSNVRDA